MPPFGYCEMTKKNFPSSKANSRFLNNKCSNAYKIITITPPTATLELRKNYNS
jgi:hypothetical protein